MASLKALRLRIKSIKSTQKITKAMQMVAASKLRRAKNAMEDNIPYHDTATKALLNLPRAEEDPGFLEKLVLHGGTNHKKTLAIVITSERGLCGGFNQAVLRSVKTDVDRMKANGAIVKIIALGKKGMPMLSNRYGGDVITHYANPSNIDFAFSSRLCSEAIALIEKEGFDSLRIYFSHFKNAVVQVPKAKFVVPALHEEGVAPTQDYECEGEQLVDNVIKMYIAAEIYKALLESRASEEAARMIAMDNATKNAGEMIDKLTLVMNRSRQATITKELIEIISGAEAV